MVPLAHLPLCPFLPLLPFCHPARIGAFVATIVMEPQLDAARRILIKTILKERFEAKLINSLKNPSRESA